VIGKNNGSIGHKIGTTLPRPGVKSALRQVLALQVASFNTAMVLSKDACNLSLTSEQRCKAGTALSNLIKAWDCAEDRKRILRGRGLPRPSEPTSKGRRPTFAQVLSGRDARPSFAAEVAVNTATLEPQSVANRVR